MSKSKLSAKEITLFAILGALMFAFKKVLEFLPNIHPVTMLTIVYTVVYRKKAILPIFIYLVLDTLMGGGLAIVPYYYIFPLFYGIVLLLPRDMKPLPKQVMYSVISAVFGISFGMLYAPWSAVIFLRSFELEKIATWIIAGIPYDILHAVGNFGLSFLIIPLVKLLERIEKSTTR